MVESTLILIRYELIDKTLKISNAIGVYFVKLMKLDE